MANQQTRIRGYGRMMKKWERLEDRYLMTASQVFVSAPGPDDFLFGSPCPGEISELSSVGDYTGDGIDDVVAIEHHCSDVIRRFYESVRVRLCGW